MNTTVKETLENKPVSFLSLPVIETRVHAGFPSPACDYIENKLDLNEFLIYHPSDTYFIRVEGNSMTGANIFDSDLLIVDRAVRPVQGSIVIANINGDLTVKKIGYLNGKLYLVAENEDYVPIEITEQNEFSVWGVVIHSIHSFKSKWKTYSH